MAAKLTGGPKGPIGRDPDYPLVGETLGLWRLCTGIGRGGMGEVYEAEYDYLHLLTLRYDREERNVIRQELAGLPREEQARMASEMLGTPLPAAARFAIKVCSARRGTAGYRRFLQEAELAEKLGTHPYIVTVHAIHKGLDAPGGEAVAGSAHLKLLDSGKYRDLAYMVMDLAVRDYDHARLELNEAIHVIRCIATALDHAHQAKIIHRDLKPENILGDVEEPLLTDFGIAKEVDQSLGLTRTGQVIGTLDYMSPEQATDAKTVDHRSDIYSLGVVLYEFATGGHLPYIHLAEREACLAAIRSETGQPKWPRDHVKEFPRRLERIILKATAHRPEDRYQEMSDFIHDLDKFARGEWISPLGRIKPITYLRYLRHRHSRLVYGVPAAVLAAVITILVLWILHQMDPQRNHFKNQIEHLERMAKIVGTEGYPQLDVNDRRELTDLVNNFQREEIQEKFPEFYEKIKVLSRAIATRRYLNADFVNDPEQSWEQLKLAARNLDKRNKPNWRLSEHGLLINDELLELRFHPYGDGRVYVDIQLRNDTDMARFKLLIREYMDDGNPAVHETRVGYRDGRLRIERDTADGVEILPWKGTGTGPQQTIALEVSAEHIRSWSPGMQVLVDQPGITARHPAEVVIYLPKNTVLYRLGLWPDPPQ